MSNLPWFIVVGGVGAFLVWILAAGIRVWSSVGGKIIAITAGLLLACWLAFVTLVAVIVISAKAGHPF